MQKWIAALCDMLGLRGVIDDEMRYQERRKRDPRTCVTCAKAPAVDESRRCTDCLELVNY